MKINRYLIAVAVSLNTAFALNNVVEKKEDAANIVVKGNTQFAFDLYARLKTSDGNLFFSPYSISTALAMTYEGAKGQTAEQMAKTLHFESAKTALDNGFGYLIEQLNRQREKDDYQLSVANALWGQKDYPFLDTFIQLNRQYYHAGLENVDFINETEQSRQTINQWVEDKTQGKIKDLISPGALNTMTRLVLTNAIYFKGTWAEPFEKAQTKDAPFYSAPGKTITAPLMFQKTGFQFGQTETVQILELPYQGGDLSMVILLPREKDGLPMLEQQLSAENVRRFMSLTGRVPIRVFLPKFKMTSQFSLKETLSKMGMPLAFDVDGSADFSGMSRSGDLSLSDVVHKAFVEVNEEGTEAAAATGVMVAATAMSPRPIEFRADHPFVFLIKDNKTGSILFIGRVTDPTKAGQ